MLKALLIEIEQNPDKCACTCGKNCFSKHTCVCAHTQTHIHTSHTYTYTYICIYTYMHIHTHTHMRLGLLSKFLLRFFSLVVLLLWPTKSLGISLGPGSNRTHALWGAQLPCHQDLLTGPLNERIFGERTGEGTGRHGGLLRPSANWVQPSEWSQLEPQGEGTACYSPAQSCDPQNWGEYQLVPCGATEFCRGWWHSPSAKSKGRADAPSWITYMYTLCSLFLVPRIPPAPPAAGLSFTLGVPWALS